jgi:hypothetical protein
MAEHDNRVLDVIKALVDYDEAVAIQAASLLKARGVSVDDREILASAKQAGPQVERGFRAFFEAWRAGEMARSKAK